MDGARKLCHIGDFAINGVDTSITRVGCLHFPGVHIFKVHMFIKRNWSVLRVQCTERAKQLLRDMGTKNSSAVSWNVINVCERQASALQLSRGHESSRWGSHFTGWRCDLFPKCVTDIIHQLRSVFIVAPFIIDSIYIVHSPTNALFIKHEKV